MKDIYPFPDLCRNCPPEDSLDCGVRNMRAAMKGVLTFQTTSCVDDVHGEMIMKTLDTFTVIFPKMTTK